MPVEENQNFDLVRLTKSKKTVDLSSNTIRAYAKRGLNLYRQGRAVFFSKMELAAFIRKGVEQSVAKPCQMSPAGGNF